MNDEIRHPSKPDGDPQALGYHAPTITRLGTLADLTQKTVGRADGSTFLGLAVGSI